MIGSSQTSLLDNTQHQNERDIHALGGNRSRNPSKHAAADPLLRLPRSAYPLISNIWKPSSVYGTCNRVHVAECSVTDDCQSADKYIHWFYPNQKFNIVGSRTTSKEFQVKGQLHIYTINTHTHTCTHTHTQSQHRAPHPFFHVSLFTA